MEPEIKKTKNENPIELTKEQAFQALPDVLLASLQIHHPLIHTMTSAVSANFCANVLLAIDAKPVMAESIADAAQISKASDALALNLGQLSPSKLEAMIEAGLAQRAKKDPANQAGRDGLIVLDPCGCAGSDFRRQSALQIMDILHPDVIRGNRSELLALVDPSYQGRGVDDTPALAANPKETQAQGENLNQGPIDQAWKAEQDLIIQLQRLARQTQAIIVCSGSIDWICDGRRVIGIGNGTPLLARVTATGCASGTMIAAMACCLPDHPLEAAAWAMITMGLCGQQAATRLQAGQGTGTFAIYLLDALSTLKGEWLKKGADYELFQTDIETLCLDGSKLSSRTESE